MILKWQPAIGLLTYQWPDRARGFLRGLRNPTSIHSWRGKSLRRLSSILGNNVGHLLELRGTRGFCSLLQIFACWIRLGCAACSKSRRISGELETTSHRATVRPDDQKLPRILKAYNTFGIGCPVGRMRRRGLIA